MDVPQKVKDLAGEWSDTTAPIYVELTAADLAEMRRMLASAHPMRIVHAPPLLPPREKVEAALAEAYRMGREDERKCDSVGALMTCVSLDSSDPDLAIAEEAGP